MRKAQPAVAPDPGRPDPVEDELTTMMAELDGAARQQLGLVGLRTERARAVLHDAGHKLADNLCQIDNASERQRGRLAELQRQIAGQGDATPGAGPAAVQPLLREISAVMREFNQALAGVSGLTNDALVRVDAMASRSDGVLRLLQRFDQLADESALLSFNASLEAARAGQAGLGFATVAHKVRELSQGSRELSAEMVEQARQLREEMVALRALMTSLANKELTEARPLTARADRTLSQLEQLNARIAQGLDAVGQAATVISDNVKRALTSVQFEDLVSQLLPLLSRSVGRIDGVIASLHDRVASRKPGWSLLERLGTAIQTVRRMRAEWTDDEHDSVQQTSMATGTVELF